VKFRASQNAYLLQLNSREERSQKYFDDGGGAGDVFTNVELGSVGNATRMGVRNNGSLDTEAGQICWLSLRPHPKTSPLLESARQ